MLVELSVMLGDYVSVNFPVVSYQSCVLSLGVIWHVGGLSVGYLSCALSLGVIWHVGGLSVGYLSCVLSLGVISLWSYLACWGISDSGMEAICVA